MRVVLFRFFRLSHLLLRGAARDARERGSMGYSPHGRDCATRQLAGDLGRQLMLGGPEDTVPERDRVAYRVCIIERKYMPWSTLFSSVGCFLSLEHSAALEALRDLPSISYDCQVHEADPP